MSWRQAVKKKQPCYHTFPKNENIEGRNIGTSFSTKRVKFLISKSKEKYSIYVQSQGKQKDECNPDHKSNDCTASNDCIIDCEVQTLNQANNMNALSANGGMNYVRR